MKNEHLIAKINPTELQIILFAAKWQLSDWQHKTPNEFYKSALKTIDYLNNYIKDFPSSNYLLSDNIYV